MRSLMPRHLAGLISLSLLAGTAAGCGDGPAVPVRDRTIRVTLDEYLIAPQRISAPAGRLHIVTSNVGRLTHNLAIETIPANPQATTPTVLRRTPTLHHGEHGEADVTLKPGTYRIVCTIANHDVLGQYGTLVVR
jgi:hypothetical protein